MVMDLPTIHQLTILILRPIPTSVCPFMLHTGFIAGHTYVPAGGGEDSLVRSSPTLLESFRCWVGESSYRLCVVSRSFWLPCSSPPCSGRHIAIMLHRLIRPKRLQRSGHQRRHRCPKRPLASMRSQRGIEQRTERDHVLHRAVDVVVGDGAAGQSRPDH